MLAHRSGLQTIGCLSHSEESGGGPAGILETCVVYLALKSRFLPYVFLTKLSVPSYYYYLQIS